MKTCWPCSCCQMHCVGSWICHVRCVCRCHWPSTWPSKSSSLSSLIAPSSVDPGVDGTGTPRCLLYRGPYQPPRWGIAPSTPNLLYTKKPQGVRKHLPATNLKDSEGRNPESKATTSSQAHLSSMIGSRLPSGCSWMALRCGRQKSPAAPAGRRVTCPKLPRVPKDMHSVSTPFPPSKMGVRKCSTLAGRVLVVGFRYRLWSLGSMYDRSGPLYQ